MMHNALKLAHCSRRTRIIEIATRKAHVEHARIRHEDVPAWQVGIAQVQFPQRRVCLIFQHLRMFFGFPPFDMIVYTRVAKDTEEND